MKVGENCQHAAHLAVSRYQSRTVKAIRKNVGFQERLEISWPIVQRNFELLLKDFAGWV